MLLLLFLFLSIAFGQDCPKNWGGLTEWAYADGGNVTLTSNTILRKDVDVQFLEIPAGMKLVIDDLAKIVIRARNIYVWGEFHIGSETCAHQGNVEIVFTGPYLATTGNEGIKGMTVYGTGIVNMFGAPAMPTWTFLTKNGEINDTSITLEDSVGWKVGDKIVIASSDFDQTQAEMLTVTRVQDNVVSFAEKLNWLHWGAELKYVDERAEVGRLTRNIKLYGEVVQGDPSPKGQWFGGHTLFQTGAKVKISHVEFTKMGQGGELARYPVHFHIGRDGTGNYVKGSSFHNNFQRCITVHWTDNLIIKDNVAYNATGHCYFLEEGNEVGNTFEHNLGVVTFNVGDPLRRIIPSDETQSAMFWITNTNNTYIKNAAAGGAFGYWYALPENPIGMAGDSGAYAKSLFGRYLGLGIFDQNRGHSATSSGLFIDQGPAPDGQTRDLVSYSPRNYSIDPDFAATLTGAELENLINNRPPQYMTFSNFIGHHNRENGVWGRGDSMILKGARLSNNKRGATFPGGPNFLYDTIFVGDSANIGSVPDNQKATAQGRSRPYWWDPATQICGYQHYDCCGPNFVINALFFNYTDTKFVFTSSRRRTGAITFLNGQHPIPPNTRFFNIKFENVQNRLLVLDDPNQRTAFKHASLVDADGSITGKCGSIIVPNQPIFIREGCKVMPDWNMAYCPPNTAIPRYTTSVALTTNPNVYPYFYESLAGAATYGDDYYDNSTNYPANQYGVGRLTVYRLDDGKSIWAAGYQDSDYPTQPGKVTYSMNYMQNLLSNTEYFYQFPVAEGTPARLRIGLYQTPVNEWIRAAVAYPVGTTFPAWGPNNYAAISSCNNIQYTSNCPMTAVATKNDLKRNTYYWDSAAGILWLHIQPATQQYSYRHGFVWENSQGEVYITAACPNNQCNVSSATAFYNLDKNGAVFSKKAPYNAAQTIMCNKNGYGDLGKVEYKSIDVENVIIGDAVQKPWQIPTWSYKNLTWSNAAVQLNVSAYGYLYVGVNDYPSNYSFNLSMLNGTGPFAFQFDIKFEQPSPLLASRTQQMKGEIPLTLSVQDKYSSTRYDAVVNSPFTVPNPPIGTTWQTATVPFKMFNNGGLPTNINISAFFIQVSSGFNTIFYADNVKIISYSESWTSVTPPTYLALTTAKTDDPLNLSPILAPVDPCAGTGLGGSNGGSSGGGGGASGKDAGLIVLAILLVAAIAVAIFFWHKFRMASSVSSHMTT